ncbi:hypothetical protein TCON_1604 [Astathelohania contejeani]|uniref:Fibroblast growth factor n=1 Tax=Astathelohania contejeani TaxID=164912 RepID=A0ABQ7HYD2_9MICR|nr:hypothetical protein TCON_1604 [Thelohania contejeani]
MIKIILFILWVARGTEAGYFYSVDEHKFLTYDTKFDGRRIYTVKSKMPRSFGIKESGEGINLIIKALEIHKKKQVIDISKSSGYLITYAYHGGENQKFILATALHGMVKLYVGDKCVSIQQDSRFLKEENCNAYDVSPGQYFRWFPMAQKSVVRNLIGKKNNVRVLKDEKDLEDEYKYENSSYSDNISNTKKRKKKIDYSESDHNYSQNLEVSSTEDQEDGCISVIDKLEKELCTLERETLGYYMGLY